MKPNPCSYLIVFLLSVTACSQKPTVYSDYAELRSSGVVEKGWIPDLVPEDAKRISELHDVDSGHSNVEFSYNAYSAPGMVKGLKPTAEFTGKQAASKFSLPPWSKLRASNKISAYLSCDSGSAVVLLDSEQQIGHYLEPVPADFAKCE